MNNTSTIVSVAVISYNSSRTILETLDSIYNQTYSPLELIICDDCSTDDTVELCRNWIHKHQNRFLHTDVVLVSQNTGVPANMNRAFQACRTNWLKTIAGDDILLPDCIQTNVDYIKMHPDNVIVFSDAICFGGDEFIRNKEAESYNGRAFFSLSIEKQLEYVTLCGLPVFAPSTFYNVDKAKVLGIEFDERIPGIDDLPIIIRTLKHHQGVLGYIDSPTVKYRISESSLSTTTQKSQRFLRSMLLFQKYYRVPYLLKHGKYKNALQHYVAINRQLYESLFWKASNKILKILFGHMSGWTEGFNVQYCFWLEPKK